MPARIGIGLGDDASAGETIAALTAGDGASDGDGVAIARTTAKGSAAWAITTS